MPLGTFGRSWATTIGWPVVGRSVASKPMSFKVATHQSAAFRQLGLYAGSVETLSIFRSSNRRSRPAWLDLSSAVRTCGRWGEGVAIGISRVFREAR